VTLWALTHLKHIQDGLLAFAVFFLIAWFILTRRCAAQAAAMHLESKEGRLSATIHQFPLSTVIQKVDRESCLEATL